MLLFVLLEQRSSQETRRAEGLLKDLQAANAAVKAAHQKEKELAIAEERTAAGHVISTMGWAIT